MRHDENWIFDGYETIVPKRGERDEQVARWRETDTDPEETQKSGVRLIVSRALLSFGRKKAS